MKMNQTPAERVSILLNRRIQKRHVILNRRKFFENIFQRKWEEYQRLMEMIKVRYE